MSVIFHVFSSNFLLQNYLVILCFSALSIYLILRLLFCIWSALLCSLQLLLYWHATFSNKLAGAFIL
jgi:hypothetical protein